MSSSPDATSIEKGQGFGPSRRSPIARPLILVALVSLVSLAGPQALSAPASVRSAAPGTALAQVYRSGVSMNPLKPGTRWIQMEVPVQNISTDPVKLIHVRLEGSGLGKVLQIGRMRVAPRPPLVGPRRWVFGGLFVTNPPTAMLHPGVCNLQELDRVRGFVLPGSRDRRHQRHALLAIFMRARKVGSYHLRAEDVTYRQSGTLYTQRFPFSFSGKVRNHGGAIPPISLETECFGASHHL